MEAIVHVLPPTPVRLNADVPPALEEIISKALQKDRALRYQHAADLCADLKRLQRQTESAQAGVVRPSIAILPSRTRRGWQVAVASA